MSTSSTDGAALAVKTTGLTKRFGQRKALDGVDLEVPRGVAFGFLGPNGAGKTTIIRLLLALAWPTSGSMSVLGHAVPAQRARALSGVGAIVEEPTFYGFLSGRENLEVNAAARGGMAAQRIPAAMERVGLSARAGDRVSSYSLGMRQRLGIARCLLADPELLFLDEPMNGLDPGGMLEVRGLIRGLVDEGRTVFLSSHLLDEVQRTCDFAAIVDRGRVVTQGSIDELTARNRRISIGTDDPGRAAALVANLHGVDRAAVESGGVVVSLAANGTADRELVTEIVRRMLDARLAIDRVAPIESSLEERFLNITQRLEDEK
ncbi:MAG TPA: ABC transporter ATP-binding protein [Solirubrobacteraceae bacterium]|nr:ABC transporter ATP-binding protein [Solirubrobacteraceae bacterium]